MTEQALTKIEEPQGELPAIVKAPITSAQAKIDAVASLTMSAYAKASTLTLTQEEVAALQADFPDEAFQPGAAGKESLIYIEHAHLRDRMNQVFGPGQWSIVPRNRWAEDFSTGKGTEASRVYVEAMLCIRGCFVAEAVGDMVYYKNNDSQNYGDAVEGAKTAALRRCAKELGIGLQAWKKSWCQGWWDRRNGKSKTPNRGTQREATGKPQGNQRETKPPAPAQATEEQRQRWLGELKRRGEYALGYCYDKGWLLPPSGPEGDMTPGEPLETLDLRHVPVTKRQAAEILAELDSLLPVDQARELQDDGDLGPQNDEQEHHKAPWYNFKMPFGKNQGAILGKLDKKYLFGLWANFVVEKEYNGKPKKPETIERDREFRVMLDQAGVFYEFEEPDNRD